MIISLSADRLPWSTIEAVAKWQNYGSSYKSVIKKFLQALPLLPKTKKYTGVAYRAIGLSAVLAKDFYLTGLECRPVESWTTSKKVIDEFLQHNSRNTFAEGSTICLVFKKNLTEDNCVLDLSALHKNIQFKQSIEYYEERKKFFNEGLDFEGYQKEIAVSLKTLSSEDLLYIIVGGKIYKGKQATNYIKKL
jgi:hypothetical protein